MVFAAALDDPEIGFALTAGQITNAIGLAAVEPAP
jgi:hypothetical protein